MDEDQAHMSATSFYNLMFFSAAAAIVIEPTSMPILNLNCFSAPL